MSHCNVEVGLMLPDYISVRGSERLDLLQFDKYERCKHCGFALSCFRSENYKERNRPCASM